MLQNRRLFAVILGIIISIVFLTLAFRELKPETLIDHIRGAQFGWLTLGAVTYFLAVTVIALRWQFLLRSIQLIPLRSLTSLVAIGYMGNNVYPLRAGEVLRIFLLKRNHGVPIAKATTTVIVERTFDGLVMLTFIVVSLLFIDVQSDEIRTVATFAAPIFLTALAIFFLLAARPNLLRRLSAVVSRILPGAIGEIVLRISEGVISGLEGLRSPADLAGAVISSYVTWAIEASVYWMVMFAFDLKLGYPAALLVVGVVNLAGLIPASPGQLGVYEFFVSAVLIAIGIGETQAAAFAIVVHVVIWLPVTLAGFFFLVRQGLGWSAIIRARELETVASSE